MKTLLIEDNPADARLIREMLKEYTAESFEIQHVARLDLGLECLRKETFDVLLLDLSLPGSQGMETLTHTHKAWGGLPIVVLTGLDDEQFALEVMRAGAQDYLVKGHFDTQLLIRTIRYAVKRKQAEEEIRRLNAELERRVDERTAQLQTANEELQKELVERKQAEQLQQSTLQRFYTILSNLNSSILLVSDEGKIEFANQAFCVLFELKESPAELMAAFDSEKVIAKIDTAYQNPELAVLRVREIVKLGQSVFGEEITLQNGATVLRDFVPLTVDGKSYGRMWVHTDISERVQGEQLLRESRATLEAALASMTDAVFISDAEGRLLHINDAFVQYHRFSSKTECSKSIADCPNYLEAFMANGEPAPTERWAMPRALRGETVTSTEYTLRRKDTGETWVGGYSFAPIRGQDGAIIGSVVTARDITEAKRNETRLKRFYESELFAVLYWKIDGEVAEANDKFLELTGYSREDLRAGLLNWAEITPPEYWEADQDARRQIRETGVHLPYEKEFIRKDGQRVWGLFSAAAYEDDRNQGVSFILDITKRKQAEALLQEERAALRGILDATDESIWLIGADCTILSANATAVKRTGWPAGEIIGKTIHEITGFKLGESRSACIRQVVETAQPLDMEDERDGILFLHHYYPVLDSHGCIDRVVVYSRDITESRKAEETLHRYQLLARHAKDIVLFIRYDDGLILEANAAAVEAYGYEVEQLKRLTIHDLRETGTRPLAPSEMAQAEMQGILFESIHQRTDGSVFPVEVSSQGANIGGTRTLISIVRDITQRKEAEHERQIAIDFLGIINRSRGTKDLLQRAASFFQERSGFEAVGIRMREGDDYPYLETCGFSQEFVKLESEICARDASGEVICDSDGHSILECLCGNVIRGRFEPSKPFYTAHGSFWTNSTTALVAGATEGDLPSTARHRCNREGYESVALFPITAGDERFGLVQFNDSHKGRFTEQYIALWERMAGHLATAVSKFQAEEALQESEKRYRNLFNTMDEGFCIIEVLFDADGKPADHLFLEVNDAFERHTGLRQVVGKRMRELAPDNEDHWFELYGQVALTGEPAHYQNEAKALGRYFSVHAYRVEEPEKRRVAIVFDDITGLKRAEEALQESEKRYRNLFDTMDEGFCIIEVIFDAGNKPVDYRFLQVNEAFERQTGLYEAEGKLMREIAPDHEAHWFEIYGKIALTGESAHFQNEAKALNRHYSVHAYRVGEPEMRRVAIVFDDISEIKRAEEALQESENRLRVALDAGGMGTWDMDIASGAANWNEEMCLLLGYEPESTPASYEGWKRRVLPEDLSKAETALRESLEYGGDLRSEYRVYSGDDEVRWVEARGRCERDTNGNAIRSFGVMMDITVRKRAEERLGKLNRTLKAMSNSNQAILLATDETSFLQEACRIISNDCGHAMVWVGIAEQDEDKTVRPVAYAGFEEGYLEAQGVTWDESERGRGPTGTAIRTGEPSICRNMLTDPAFAPWRENAIKRGYASSLVIPLKERGEAWGAITIYAQEPDAFSEGEVDLLTELAGDLELGVQTLRIRAAHAKAEDALREREELLGLFVEHAPAALAMFDDKMRYLHASRRWMADYGLGDRDLRGVSHYDVFPETPEHWKEAHRRGMAGEVLSGEADRIERTDGSEQWIRWEVRPWRDAEGKVGGIVIFSEEITERKKAEEERLRSEKVALQRQQLQALAVRLQQVREEERKMVARDLHDQIGQILTAIKMDVTWVVRQLPRAKDDMHARLAKSIEMINDGVRSVRKICSGLRPGILDDLGLSAAIEWQANEFASRTGIPCQVTVPPDELHLDGDRTTAIFRIFQECLTNVARHAEARSVRASLYEQDGDLLLVVQDDGKGFSEAGIAGSLGVLGMKERAQVCGGSVQVSSSPGKGTTVTACVPVHAASAESENHEHSDS